MRYLYGDMTPFPMPFDFLRTLEAFVGAAARVVLLEHRARSLVSETLATQRMRAGGLETLARVHETVVRTLEGPVARHHPLALEYAERLTEQAGTLLEEHRKRAQEADEADAARVRDERTRTNEEIATHLRGFFQAARLPTVETWLSTTLADGKPEARARFVHGGGVGVAFTLGTSKAPAWSAPRKLGDLVGQVELVVDIKKAWIGGKVTREPVRIADWVIGSAELGDAMATIALRRRADQKDALVFKLRRDGAAFAAYVEHPGDPNAALVSPSADPADVPHLERLWVALRATFDEILEDRAAVTSITLDGEDAIGTGRGQDVVERIVAVFAPTAIEIARRSPNVHELSLKREAAEGRREELYLARATLLDAIAPLPREGRAIFAPLGLSDAAPDAKTRPLPGTWSEVSEELSSRDLEDV